MAYTYIPYDGPVVTRDDAKIAGRKTFFTGVPCKQGHMSERHVWSSKACVACYSSKLETRNEKRRLAEAPKRDKINAKQRARRERDRDHVNAVDRARRAVRRPCETEAYKIRRTERAEYLREYSSDWAKKNSDKRAVNHANRRARKAAAGGAYTVSDIKYLFDIQQGKCAHSWCKKSIKVAFHRDHIIPLAIGGRNDRKNLQLLCRSCNLKKRSSHPIGFAQKNGLLL